MKGRVFRNQVLEQLLPLLWHGLTDKAVVLIKEIPCSQIKGYGHKSGQFGKSLIPTLCVGMHTERASTPLSLQLAHGCTVPPCVRGQIKDTAATDKLIQYLNRNRPYIPCYAIRKELGLRNSSSIGEKMNDLVVSERQKHNGMSWSLPGSVALASITALKRNGESTRWFEKRELRFKMAV